MIIQCKICNQSITFDPTNPETYLSKIENKNAILGTLITYRIRHVHHNQAHVNVIVLDENGEYRAHKDYYTEPLQESTENQAWIKLYETFPVELRHFLDLTSSQEKQVFITQWNPELDTQDVTKALEHLWRNYPKSQVILLMLAKWYYVIDELDKLIALPLQPQTWGYCYHLRALSKLDPRSQLLEDLKSLDVDMVPNALKHEVYMSKAEIMFRTNCFDELETLFRELQQLDVQQLPNRIALMFTQVLYAMSLFYQGNEKDAVNLIEPAYTFAQLIDHKSLIINVGIPYGIVLTNLRDYEKTLQVYNTVYRVAQELGNERAKYVVLTNIAVLKIIEGRLQDALIEFRKALDNPLVKNQVTLRIPAYINYIDVLEKLGRYDEAFLVGQTLLKDTIPKNFIPDVLIVIADLTYATQNSKLLMQFLKKFYDFKFTTSVKTEFTKAYIDFVLADLKKNYEKALQHLHHAHDLLSKANMIEYLEKVEYTIAKEYVKYYELNPKKEFLEKAITHLDNAFSIGIESGQKNLIYVILLLKSLVLAKLNQIQQALAVLEEAKRFKENNALRDPNQLLEQTSKEIELLQKKKQGLGIFNKLSRSLGLLNPIQHQTPTKEVVKVLWLQEDTQNQTLFLKHKTVGLKDIMFMKGVIETWEFLMGNTIEFSKIMNTSHGYIVFERSQGHTIIALLSSNVYQTRLEINQLLQSILSWESTSPMIDFKQVYNLIRSAFTGMQLVHDS